MLGDHVTQTTIPRKSPLTQFSYTTLGQKQTFYPEIPYNLMFEKCEFCEK